MSIPSISPNRVLKWDVVMTKILLGICVAIGLMNESDEIKSKFVESDWRDKVVSNLMSIDHKYEPNKYWFGFSSRYPSYN